MDVLFVAECPASVTPRYLGWGVFSTSVLFHFTFNVLFVPYVECRVTWVLSGFARRLLDL